MKLNWIRSTLLSFKLTCCAWYAFLIYELSEERSEKSLHSQCDEIIIGTNKEEDWWHQKQRGGRCHFVFIILKYLF